jgi:hypothetical protein
MLNKAPNFFTYLAILNFLLLHPVQAEEETRISGDQMIAEGGGASPIRLEPTEDGVRAILEHREKAYNAIRIPMKANTAQTNLLKFRARFDSPDPELRQFQVILMDARGMQYATTFSRQAQKQDDGSYVFSWDVTNEPNQDQGADLENIREVRFKFDFGAMPKVKGLELEVDNLRFVSGPSTSRGDKVRFEAWKKRFGTWEPDTSDSSHFLQPPTTGRLATPVALVENGHAKAKIVLAEDAGETEKLAVGELQLWIQKITGAELPIVSEVPESDATAIFLGVHLARDHFASDLKALAGSDGFAVRAKGNQIFIFGAQPKGTMNGVFAFLENNSDLIWARPQPDYGTIFSKTPDFTARWADARERPAARYRGWLPNLGGGDAFWLWSDRNRNNFVGGNTLRQIQWGDRAEFGGGHNLQTFIPKDDPRYYPTIDGKKPDKLSIWKHQICLSVPDLVKTYSANVVKYIQEKAPSGIQVFNIKIEDNWGVCECADCLAPLHLPDGTVVNKDNPAFRSTQFYQFLNQVTQEVNKTFPGLVIQTYAYFYTAVPPLVKLDDHIAILFCPYVRPDHRTPLFAPINSTWWDRLTAWAAITPNVVIREYYGILNEGRPLAEVVAGDVKADLELGVRDFTAEITPDFLRVWSDGELRGGEDEFDLSAMEYWLINRVYWNPDANIEDLRKYYLRRTFREAAPFMEKFFGTIRQGWFETLRPPSDWGNSQQMWKRTVLDKKLEDTMRKYLEDALRAATHPSSRILISKIQKRLLHDLELIRQPATRTGETSLTPAQRFSMGWTATDRGSGSENYSTSIEIEGKVKPAQRLIVKDVKANKPIFSASFPLDVTGMTFRFVVIPPEGEQLPDTLPLLSITDKKWGVETATMASYSPSTRYPNGKEFVWTPTGQGEKGVAVDLKNVTRLQLFFSNGGQLNHDFVILLIDMSVEAEP